MRCSYLNTRVLCTDTVGTMLGRNKGQPGGHQTSYPHFEMNEKNEKEKLQGDEILSNAKIGAIRLAMFMTGLICLVFAIIACNYVVSAMPSLGSSLKTPFRYTRGRIIDIPDEGLFVLSGGAGSQHLTPASSAEPNTLFQTYAESVGEVCVPPETRDIAIPEYMSSFTVYAGRLLNVPAYSGHSTSVLMVMFVYAVLNTVLVALRFWFSWWSRPTYDRWYKSGFNPLRYLQALLEAAFLAAVLAPLVGIYDLQTKVLLVVLHVTAVFLHIADQLLRSEYINSLTSSVSIRSMAGTAVRWSFGALTIIHIVQAHNAGRASENLPDAISDTFDYKAPSSLFAVVYVIFFLRFIYFGGLPGVTAGWFNVSLHSAEDETKTSKCYSMRCWIHFIEEIFYDLQNLVCFVFIFIYGFYIHMGTAVLDVVC